VVIYKRDGKNYFNINVKFKNKITSIYIGSYDKLKVLFKSKLSLKRIPTVGKVKELIQFHFVEEVIDLCIENKDDFDKLTIRKEMLYELPNWD
jgi:hypothetical protein